MPLDEKKLIRQAQNGDKAAFQSLIERYYPYVTRFLTGLCKNQQKAEDLAQDTFLKTIRSIERFDLYGSASFATWMMTIARHTYIDHLRKNKHVTVNIDDFEIAVEKSVEDKIIEKTMADSVLRAIETLPPEQAAAVSLRHLEHLTLNEIAAQMNCQPKTVKSRIHNGTVRLRKILIGGKPHG